MKIKFGLTFLFLLTISNPSYGGAKNDVLDVKGKAVVFFGPEEKDYNLLSEDEKNEWSEVLSDFYYYRDKTIPYLESNNIKPIATSVASIKVHLAGANSRSYAKQKFEHIVGCILTDGNSEPKVVLGVGTDVDMINDFKEYFKLK